MMLDVTLASKPSPASSAPSTDREQSPSRVRKENHLRLPSALTIDLPKKGPAEPTYFQQWLPTPRRSDWQQAPDDGWCADCCWCCLCCCEPANSRSPTAWSRSMVDVSLGGAKESSTRQGGGAAALALGDHVPGGRGAPGPSGIMPAQQQKMERSQSPTLRGRMRSPFVAMKSVSRDKPGRTRRRQGTELANVSEQGARVRKAGASRSAASSDAKAADASGDVRFSVHA